MLAGAWRIIYSHESFREIVELPMLPLSLDPRFRNALKQVGQGVYKGVLEQVGVNVDELEDKGLVEVKDGVVNVKDWVAKLLELTG
ncbi:MAG: putative CRISPR-associated protein, partial [Caldivirga sp.]